MTTKLYIFDMGGVVVQNSDVFGSIFDYLKVSEADFYNFCGPDFMLLSNGKISVQEFWRLFSKHSGIPIAKDLFLEFFVPKLDTEVVKLISELKHRARVVCGTNTLESHYQYHLSHEEYAVFDKVYASNKMGISKPDPNFFRYILQAENTAAAESCFVDDMFENVTAAGKLGIKTIHFAGITALKASL
ncbi:MAG TPA: HAD family phosphatase [Bacillota bacterium]|nr:HAD family phosphatase [Bacillota bacterium]